MITGLFMMGGDETLIVVSSDLSHYCDYETARRLDAATTRAIEALEPEAIGHEQACGRTPVQGLLLAAQRHGLHALALTLVSPATGAPLEVVAPLADDMRRAALEAGLRMRSAGAGRAGACSDAESAALQTALE